MNVEEKPDSPRVFAALRVVKGTRAPETTFLAFHRLYSMVVYLEHDRVGHHMDFQRCLLYDANGDVLDTSVYFKNWQLL